MTSLVWVQVRLIAWVQGRHESSMDDDTQHKFGVDSGCIRGVFGVYSGVFASLLGVFAVFRFSLCLDFRWILQQGQFQNFRPSAPFIILKGNHVIKVAKIGLVVVRSRRA